MWGGGKLIGKGNVFRNWGQPLSTQSSMFSRFISHAEVAEMCWACLWSLCVGVKGGKIFTPVGACILSEDCVYKGGIACKNERYVLFQSLVLILMLCSRKDQWQIDSFPWGFFLLGASSGLEGWDQPDFQEGAVMGHTVDQSLVGLSGWEQGRGEVEVCSLGATWDRRCWEKGLLAPGRPSEQLRLCWGPYSAGPESGSPPSLSPRALA